MSQNTKPKFPSIRLDIAGPDGNAYMVIAAVSSVMEQSSHPKEQIAAVMEDMRASDYEHLLGVAEQWITIDRSNLPEDDED